LPEIPYGYTGYQIGRGADQSPNDRSTMSFGLYFPSTRLSGETGDHALKILSCNCLILLCYLSKWRLIISVINKTLEYSKPLPPENYLHIVALASNLWNVSVYSKRGFL